MQINDRILSQNISEHFNPGCVLDYLISDEVSFDATQLDYSCSFISFHTFNLIINSYVVSVVVTEYTITFLSLVWQWADIFTGYLHLYFPRVIEPIYQLSCELQKRSLLKSLPTKHRCYYLVYIKHKKMFILRDWKKPL